VTAADNNDIVNFRIMHSGIERIKKWITKDYSKSSAIS
jgi:hypothetical protein